MSKLGGITNAKEDRLSNRREYKTIKKARELNMGKLIPFLLSNNAKAQAEFYAKSLAGEIVSVLTFGEATGMQDEMKDKVMHLSLTVAGGNSIYMSDAMEPVTHGTSIVLNIALESDAEAAQAFAKISAEGHVTIPFELQPYGMYQGEVTDKFGITWMITVEA